MTPLRTALITRSLAATVQLGPTLVADAAATLGLTEVSAALEGASVAEAAIIKSTTIKKTGSVYTTTSKIGDDPDHDVEFVDVMVLDVSSRIGNIRAEPSFSLRASARLPPWKTGEDEELVSRGARPV